MTPSSRGKFFWGLVLGLLLSIGILGLLRLAGFQLMRHGPEPPAATAPSPAAGKPLCYVSPTDPDLIRFEPGKDEKGQELVPVFPIAPGVQVVEGQKLQYWVSATDPKYVRTQPGKDPMGQDLMPVFVEKGEPGAVVKKERKIKYWISPMDPGYVSEKPGKAPCGMDLIPVYETEGEAAAEGTIAVDPNTLQSMGVRTAKAELRPLTRTIRAVGIVNYDEKKLAIVTTKINGWVDRLYAKATGEPIRKGQPLISIYSPDLVSAQREYLLALKNLKNLEKSPYAEVKESAQRLMEASRRRLEYWDIPRRQIETLEKTGEVKKDLTLASPVTGIVIKRMVTEGQMVTAGMPLLEVADLSKVWVDAQIYEYELPWVKVGQHAQMTLAYIPGETLNGTVQYIYPYLSGTTRTAKVRLSLPNPGIRLKPEMYGQVEIHAPMTQPVVAVPTEAVLDSGEQQLVFISLGKGRFEPRQVKVGMEGADGWREIMEGLKGGEEIVTSAQFLLDSESRTREAIAKMLRTREAPAPDKEAVPPGPPRPPAPAPPVHRH
jgi:Cu(I)/Ag(I) efflux system membrane fusion protein/cobalt-zinc-cadmium efflux system membrane fusion protein